MAFPDREDGIVRTLTEKSQATDREDGHLRTTTEKAAVAPAGVTVIDSQILSVIG